MSPLVSIIMATRNRAYMLDRAMRSVASQSFSDWEFLVVDDASEDETPQVLGRWSKNDARIKILRNEANRGLAASHNRALREASGIYVAVLDDDDWWADMNKLSRQVQFLSRNPRYSAVGGGIIVVNSDGDIQYRYLKPEMDGEIRESMLYANPMAHSTVMYRKDDAARVGYYDEAFRGHAADRALFLQMARTGKLHNIPEYFTYYTLSGSNMLIQHQRVQMKASLVYMKRFRTGYPHFVPALCMHYATYAYSFLPGLVRKALTPSLLYAKRKMFDRV